MREAVTQLAAIALGSNLASQRGDRDANLREAILRMGHLGEIRAVSSFLDTAPVGYTEQPRFLNAAALLETALQPLDLMRELLAIELAMGRNRAATPPKGPRVIDLDLLLMGELVINSSGLTLPHPALAERRFVLEPLAEIAPEMVDPLSHLTVLQMLHRLNPADRG
jgi:2-amino-4-hydroxy-6-hydroxymethyldihydropteridine diphosphokinase